MELVPEVLSNKKKSLLLERRTLLLERRRGLCRLKINPYDEHVTSAHLWMVRLSAVSCARTWQWHT